MRRAIDRAAIVAQVMDGEALPAAQVQPERFAGFDGNLRPPVLDRDKARRLLAEAGWGQGFRTRLSGTSDRLVNDERILQAVAQMWQRVGINTEVEPLPSTVFFQRFNAGAHAAGLTSWTGSSDELNTSFVAVLSGRNSTRGRGTANPTCYSTTQVDALMDRAPGEIDVGRRHAGWSDAQRIALSRDAAVIPLHDQVNLSAMRGALSYDARIDELTYATGVRPTSSR